MLDKLHFASAEANSMSKQAEYKNWLFNRLNNDNDDFSIVGKSRVRLSDLSEDNLHIVKATFKIKK